MTVKLLQYKTEGTCAKAIQVVIEDDKISQVVFTGGCNGNLKAISKLIKGLPVDEVINQLMGISCGLKNTSCADQLAKCLIQYREGKNETN